MTSDEALAVLTALTEPKLPNMTPEDYARRSLRELALERLEREIEIGRLAVANVADWVRYMRDTYADRLNVESVVMRRAEIVLTQNNKLKEQDDKPT